MKISRHFKTMYRGNTPTVEFDEQIFLLDKLDSSDKIAV